MISIGDLVKAATRRWMDTRTPVHVRSSRKHGVSGGRSLDHLHNKTSVFVRHFVIRCTVHPRARARARARLSPLVKAHPELNVRRSLERAARRNLSRPSSLRISRAFILRPFYIADYRAPRR